MQTDFKAELNPEDWVERYGDVLCRYAIVRVFDHHIAEELVQETFLAALSAQRSFQGKSAEQTWLIGILKNKIVDYFRKTVRELQGEVDSHCNSDNLFNEKEGWNKPIASWDEDPGDPLHKKEFWIVLNECLKHLSAAPASCFVLKEMEGMNVKKICKVLGLSSTNVWTSLHRARFGLRHCLEKNWFGSEDK